MSTIKKNKNYFEQVYLGKNNEATLQENKRLQKLLTIKAMTNSIDSKRLTTADLKKMAPKKLKSCNIIAVDFDSYIFPYEYI